MSEDYETLTDWQIAQDDEIDNRLWHEYMDSAEIQDKIHEHEDLAAHDEDYEFDPWEYLEDSDYFNPTYFGM